MARSHCNESPGAKIGCDVTPRLHQSAKSADGARNAEPRALIYRRPFRANSNTSKLRNWRETAMFAYF